VDLDRGIVTMIEERDKTHQRITRPLTWDAYSALLTAQHWRVRLGYTGPWVFFAGQARRDGPWSYQAANQALRRAERAAQVPHIQWRAFHGVRRMVAANVSSRTGTRRWPCSGSGTTCGRRRGISRSGRRISRRWQTIGARNNA
jgi:integrase